MEQIIEWLMSLDTTAISAAIVGLITTYGGTLLLLAISSIKNKIKKTQFEETISQAKLESEQSLNSKMDAFQKNIINILTGIQEDIMSKENASQQERLNTLKALVNDVETSNVTLNKVSDSKDIDKILDELE